MIGSGLRCRVRTVWSVRSGLGKRRIVGSEGAVNLVGGYVQEAEVISSVVAQTGPICTRLFEEREGSVDVRVDELVRSADLAVYMSFRDREHDPVRLTYL